MFKYYVSQEDVNQNAGCEQEAQSSYLALIACQYAQKLATQKYRVKNFKWKWIDSSMEYEMRFECEKYYF